MEFYPSYGQYEEHHYSRQDFPLLFHYDLYTDPNERYLHWHENLEFLLILTGSCRVQCGLDERIAHVGDIVVVNPNELHAVRNETEQSKLCCLIISPEFVGYDSPGFSQNERFFENLVRDDELRVLFEKIMAEMDAALPFYEQSVKGMIITLLAGLCRRHVAAHLPETDPAKPQKIPLVKAALQYIQNNYFNDFSVDELCAHIGYSKYYFCRTFKEATGKTMVEYVNYLRCKKARGLLQKGYSVTETSSLVGFQNLSYFNKVYKSIMGHSPSKDK